MIPVLCDYVPLLRIQPVAEKLREDSWTQGCFLMDLWLSFNATDFQAGPWTWEPGSKNDVKTGCWCGKREVSMLYPVAIKAPMCPSVTRLIILYTISKDSRSLRIVSSLVNQDIPYGDYFSVEEEVLLQSEEDGVRVTKSWSAEFVKRTFFKSAIESQIKDSQVETCQHVMNILRQYAATMGSPTVEIEQDSDVCDIKELDVEADVSEEDAVDGEYVAFETCLETVEVETRIRSRTYTDEKARSRTHTSEKSSLHSSDDEDIPFDEAPFDVDVWELQRRTTIFQDDWRAPFLPSDVENRARWMTDKYKKTSLGNVAFV
jgi:hypothetical protein